MVTLKGKIFEIGMLETGEGRGFRMESEGEEVAINGLTEEECRTLAKFLGENIEITIAPPNVELRGCALAQSQRSGAERT